MEPKRKLAGELDVPGSGPQPIPQNEPGPHHHAGPRHHPSPEASTKRGIKIGWRRSPAFWWVMAGSVLFLALAAGYFFFDPRVGWVMFGVGISGLALAAAVAGMVSLRSRRRRDERLRSAP